MRFLKPTAAVLAIAVAALSLTSGAEARDRYRYYDHHHYSRGGSGDAVAAGIFGFAAGALFSGALSQPRYEYYGPAPVYRVAPPVVYQPAPVYYQGPQPWTPEWYAYCDQRYKSFNAQTGYFLGYDRQYHFCR